MTIINGTATLLSYHNRFGWRFHAILKERRKKKRRRKKKQTGKKEEDFFFLRSKVRRIQSRAKPISLLYVRVALGNWDMAQVPTQPFIWARHVRSFRQSPSPCHHYQRVSWTNVIKRVHASDSARLIRVLDLCVLHFVCLNCLLHLEKKMTSPSTISALKALNIYKYKICSGY